MPTFRFLTVTCLALCAMFTGSALANPADPDPSFGSGGTVTLAGVAKGSSTIAAAIQSDGTRILGYESPAGVATPSNGCASIR